MESLVSFPPLYIVVGGIVLALFSSYYLRESSKLAVGNSTSDSCPDPLALARAYCEQEKLSCSIVEHTGTGVVFHMGRNTLYIAQRAAHARNLFEYGTVLRELGRAQSFDWHRGVYKAQNLVGFILRLASMVAPLLIVICAIAQWRPGLLAGISIYAAGILYALICLPLECSVTRRAEAYARRELALEPEAASALSQLTGALALSTVQFPFQPIADLFKSIKPTTHLIHDVDGISAKSKAASKQKKR